MVGGVGNANDVVVGDVETDLTLGFDLDLRSSKILVSINEVSSSAIELDLFLDDINSDVVADGGGVGVEDDTFECVTVVDAVDAIDAVVVVVVVAGW